MQVTDRPSPDAPSLTQAIIVQMVYCHPALSFCGQSWVTSQNGFHWILDTMMHTHAPLQEHEMTFCNKTVSESFFIFTRMYVLKTKSETLFLCVFVRMKIKWTGKMIQKTKAHLSNKYIAGTLVGEFNKNRHPEDLDFSCAYRWCQCKYWAGYDDRVRTLADCLEKGKQEKRRAVNNKNKINRESR